MMASCPDPEATKQLQTIILPPPFFTDGTLFLYWNAVFASCQIKHFSFKPKSSVSSTEHSSRSFLAYPHTFSQIVDGQQSYFFGGGLMNTDIHQCKIILYFLISYPGILWTPLGEFMPCSWCDLSCLTIPGEGKADVELPPFVLELLDSRPVESKPFGYICYHFQPGEHQLLFVRGPQKSLYFYK